MATGWGGHRPPGHHTPHRHRHHTKKRVRTNNKCDGVLAHPPCTPAPFVHAGGWSRYTAAQSRGGYEGLPLVRPTWGTPHLWTTRRYEGPGCPQDAAVCTGVGAGRGQPTTGCPPPATDQCSPFTHWDCAQQVSWASAGDRTSVQGLLACCTLWFWGLVTPPS